MGAEDKLPEILLIFRKFKIRIQNLNHDEHFAFGYCGSKLQRVAFSHTIRLIETEETYSVTDTRPVP